MTTLTGELRTAVEVPLDGACADAEHIVATAQALDTAGFDALGFTDHPAPSMKWLTSGGHPSFDPFAALAFCAAATERIRLMTYLTVLPYRNPLLTASSIATVDRLSGGRLIVGVGSGYLRSEFLALGRPFERRNELTDEALSALVSVFGGDAESTGFVFDGSDFVSRAQAVEPGPVQRPHPPIWIGGSSRRSRARVAEFGDGWTPLMTTPDSASTIRTAQLSTLDDLAAAVEDLHRLVADAGRDPATIEVQIDGLISAEAALEELDVHRELLGRLSAIGVTQTIVRLPRHALPITHLGLIEAYGAAFLARPPRLDPDRVGSDRT